MEETPGDYETCHPLPAIKGSLLLQTAEGGHTFVRFQGIANDETAAPIYLRYE